MVKISVVNLIKQLEICKITQKNGSFDYIIQRNFYIFKDGYYVLKDLNGLGFNTTVTSCAVMGLIGIFQETKRKLSIIVV